MALRTFKYTYNIQQHFSFSSMLIEFIGQKTGFAHNCIVESETFIP